MTFEVLEAAKLDNQAVNISEKKAVLGSGLKSSIEPTYNAYMNMPEGIDGNIARWLGTDTIVSETDLGPVRANIMDIAKQMYDGVDLGNGRRTLGLREIHNWKVHPNYTNQNWRQHAGFGAEVAGSIKENLQARLNGTGITTYRADDRPDLFSKNDQYVDKIRVNNAGEIVDRVQVKFVGKDAADCLSKLASKKFDKFFSDGKVDKMEIPKDYYDSIKELIPKRISKLEQQLQHVKEYGDAETIQKIEARISKYGKIDQMLEKSTVSSDEALEAVKRPRRYTAKLFAKDAFAESHKAGTEGAAFAATITTAVSTVDNIIRVFEGEITAQEAFVDVAKDTVIAGGLEYGTEFVSTAVSQLMADSSHQLLKSLGNSQIPATIISFAVDSFDSIIDYANGAIDGMQLTYDLGENAVQIAGTVAGTAVAGAVLGSVVPGAGTAVGYTAGLVGGMIGCAVASEAYVSAVKFGVESADVLAGKAEEMANYAVDIAGEMSPEQAAAIAASINEYAAVNDLPFRVQARDKRA